MRPALARSTLAIALGLALPLALTACSQGDTGNAGTSQAAAPDAAAVQAETQRLNAWFDAKYEEALRFSPMQLTFLGRKELYDQLDDMSEAGLRQRVEWLEASVREMESQFDYARLDPEAQLSWDLWKKQAERARVELQYLAHDYPFEQMGGRQSELPTFLIGFHKVDEEQDYLAYVSRLQKVGVAFDQLLERARAQGYLFARPMPRLAPVTRTRRLML